MSNKSSGNDFEHDFAQLLADKGYWVHRIRDNQNGQPFDIIACKDNIPYVFDCKVCMGELFALSRIEDNQRYAMARFLQTGNMHCYFALRFGKEILTVHFLDLERQRASNIRVDELRRLNIWKQL